MRYKIILILNTRLNKKFNKCKICDIRPVVEYLPDKQTILQFHGYIILCGHYICSTKYHGFNPFKVINFWNTNIIKDNKDIKNNKY